MSSSEIFGSNVFGLHELGIRCTSRKANSERGQRKSSSELKFETDTKVIFSKNCSKFFASQVIFRFSSARPRKGNQVSIIIKNLKTQQS